MHFAFLLRFLKVKRWEVTNIIGLCDNIFLPHNGTRSLFPITSCVLYVGQFCYNLHD